MTTYLKDFSKMVKKGVAYLPIGTLEWHGNHLPIETDYLVAIKLCEEFSKRKPGYILPPIYLGTDKFGIKRGKKLFGMDRHLGKKMPGSLYYINPSLLEKIVTALIGNLKVQGFRKIFLIAGHAGSGHLKALAKVAKREKGVRLVNPWENLRVDVHHAEEYETSVFWACYPKEEKISRKIKIPATDDCFRFYGYDPRKKASIEIGRKILKEMIDNCLKVIS